MKNNKTHVNNNKKIYIQVENQQASVNHNKHKEIQRKNLTRKIATEKEIKLTQMWKLKQKSYAN